MNIKSHSRSIILWILCYCFIVYYCYAFFAYNYPYIEQMDIFAFNKSYASERIFKIGGLISYLTAFMTQFFITPVVGAMISSLLFCIISWQNYDIWKKICNRKNFPLLYLLPGIALLWMQTDFVYHWEGTLGTIFSIFLLNIYLRFPSRTSRWVYMAAAIPLGYFITGPAVFTAVIGCIIYEVAATKGKYKWSALLFIPWSCLIPYILCNMDIIPQARFAFTFDLYYHAHLSAQALHYYTAVAVLLNVFLASLLVNWHGSISPKVNYAFFTVQIVIAGMVLHWGTEKYNNEKTYTVKRLDYYTRTKQWKKLLDFNGLRPRQNFMHACYQNLALSELGIMGDSLFYYDQPGIKGLVIPWDQSVNSSMLLSDVYYRMGNIALAQEMAFEGLVATERGMNPRLLLRLVQTNVIFGYYNVALKYIRILEDTRSYCKAASHYRHLIENPEYLKSDPEIMTKRKCIAGTNLLTTATQYDNIYQIVKTYPEYTPAVHYYGALCLISKNITAFSDLIKIYAETGQSMPVHFQEAFIIMHEKEADKWKEYGLDEAVINRFKSFRNDVIHARRTGSNPSRVLRGKYAGSYWYYFMFNR